MDALYKIKDLVWEKDEGGVPEARTPFGRYWVMYDDEPDGQWGKGWYWGYISNGDHIQFQGTCESEEDGKVRCQKDLVYSLRRLLEEVTP